MTPRSLRKHYWVVKLKRGLFSFWKDLRTFQRGRERFYNCRNSKVNALRKGRGRNLFPCLHQRELIFFFLFLICIFSYTCKHEEHSPQKSLHNIFKCLGYLRFTTILWGKSESTYLYWSNLVDEEIKTEKSVEWSKYTLLGKNKTKASQIQLLWAVSSPATLCYLLKSLYIDNPEFMFSIKE